jgi:hypothetical protein
MQGDAVGYTTLLRIEPDLPRQRFGAQRYERRSTDVTFWVVGCVPIVTTPRQRNMPVAVVDVPTAEDRFDIPGQAFERRRARIIRVFIHGFYVRGPPLHGRIIYHRDLEHEGFILCT